ncbi:MAG TPA: peptidoglycan-associated lipoprotein Pal [Gammaproteobacteria bacterium]|nr:peptidoglycan-associated lipoprotein Pal [Gammaproteobacteria bacterium]
MQTNRCLMVVAAAGLLVACGGKDAVPTADEADDFIEDEERRGTGIDRDRVQPGSEFGDVSDVDADLIEQRIIHFDFDSDAIRAEFEPIIAAHARYLADNSDIAVRLEGHTDERGSREYNIGLGERRAQAVRQRLLIQGASAGQISTVSYGEERPQVFESNEQAWAENRRTEIVYP